MKAIVYIFNIISNAVFNLFHDIKYCIYWHVKFKTPCKSAGHECFTINYALKNFISSMQAAKTIFQLELMKPKYRKIIPSIKLKLINFIKTSDLIQYIYWKIRIKLIKVRLISGRGANTTMKM